MLPLLNLEKQQAGSTSLVHPAFRLKAVQHQVHQTLIRREALSAFRWANANRHQVEVESGGKFSVARRFRITRDATRALLRLRNQLASPRHGTLRPSTCSLRSACVKKAYFVASKSDGLQPTSNGLQPRSKLANPFKWVRGCGENEVFVGVIGSKTVQH